MLDFFGVFNVFFFCFLGSKKCVSNTFFLYFCLGVFRMWIPALSMIFFALRLHLWRGRQPSALAPRLELKKQIKKDDEIPNSRVLMKRTFIGKYFKLKKLKNFKPFSPWFLQKQTNAMPQIFFQWPIFFTLTAWNFGDTPRSWPSYLWRHLDWLHVRWKQSQNRQNNMKYAH